ncbi:unnamed protein product, partial [Brenthis ino]
MNYLYCILFIYLLPLSTCIQPLRTYEFGDNYGYVTFDRAGNIGILEKVVKIPIVLPPCKKLTYVRVDIDNLISTPEVTFDKSMSTVTISYARVSYSKSRYWVTAKSIPDVHCLLKHQG